MSFSRAKKHSWSLQDERERCPRRVWGYELCEGDAHHKPLLEAENDDIGSENTYLWDTKAEKSRPYLGPTPPT
jgi:hypothetical protein